jgi:hypothetical protein
MTNQSIDPTIIGTLENFLKDPFVVKCVSVIIDSARSDMKYDGDSPFQRIVRQFRKALDIDIDNDEGKGSIDPEVEDEIWKESFMMLMRQGQSPSVSSIGADSYVNQYRKKFS